MTVTMESCPKFINEINSEISDEDPSLKYIKSRSERINSNLEGYKPETFEV